MTQHAALKFMLRRTFSDVVHTTNPISNELFNNIPANGKWSIADIIGHLILSTKPLTKALTTPKAMLKMAFGELERAEWNEEQLVQTYTTGLNQGLTASPKYIYKEAHHKGKENLLSSFTKELNLLIEQIDQWNQSDLSKYALPHPALGKMSIREMLYFTNYHTIHHHKQISVLIKLDAAIQAKQS